MGAFTFQPLFPDERALGPLLDQAAVLMRIAPRVAGAAGSLRTSLRPLLRSMNSYYTNRIEGQHTRPADIERALAHRFDADAARAAKQRLALAHIDTEAELEAAVAVRPAADLYAGSFIRDIHAALYRRLPPGDRLNHDGVEILPGKFRSRRVTAGQHLAPEASEIEDLLSHWAERYRQLHGVEQAIVGAACAHHRLLWIHPFLDGNGRTARLHTHLVLANLGLSDGLWSPLRGMARDVETYYARLNNADLPRRNDLDGRGMLSEEELASFAGWLLDVFIDQASFMSEMLALDGLRDRIAELLRFLAANPWTFKSERSAVHLEALEALHYTAITGPLDRGRFMAMTGLSPRIARRLLSSLIDFGVLTAANHRAPVSFAVPQRSLRFLFPRLWPEAEVQERTNELP